MADDEWQYGGEKHHKMIIPKGQPTWVLVQVN